MTVRPGLRVSLSAEEPQGRLTVQPFPVPGLAQRAEGRAWRRGFLEAPGERASAASTLVAAFLLIMFLSSQTLELCVHRALAAVCVRTTTSMLEPAVAFHGWGEVGEEVSSLFLFFVSFWFFLLFFSDTGGQTSSLDNSCILLHRSCHIAQPSHLLSVRGAENAVGAGLGAGTLHWLGFLRGQRLCADIHPIWVGLAALKLI